MGHFILVEGVKGEKITFHKSNDVSVWGTTVKNFAERNALLGRKSTEMVVDRVDMHEVINRYGIPYYLKTDIEGSDKVVLESLRKFT